jgi:hypothetical protein
MHLQVSLKMRVPTKQEQLQKLGMTKEELDTDGDGDVGADEKKAARLRAWNALPPQVCGRE